MVRIIAGNLTQVPFIYLTYAILKTKTNEHPDEIYFITKPFANLFTDSEISAILGLGVRSWGIVRNLENGPF